VRYIILPLNSNIRPLNGGVIDAHKCFGDPNVFRRVVLEDISL